MAGQINLSKMFYTYVLRSQKDSKFYFGYTSDLKKRLKEHQNGEVSSTKSRLPVNLIFYEAFLNQKDALRREKYFKTNPGKKSLKLMLRQYLSSHKDKQLPHKPSHNQAPPT